MYKKKKSNSGKFVAIVVIAILLITAVGFLGWLSDGFQNWETSTWFGSEEEAEETTLDSDLVVGDSSNSYISVASFTDYIVDDSVSTATITATVYDTDGTAPTYLQGVTWSLEWTSSSATGTVTDYVTTATTDSTVTLTMVENFNQQLTLTATSILDSTKTISIPVDCENDIDYAVTTASFSSSTTRDTVTIDANGVYNVELPYSCSTLTETSDLNTDVLFFEMNGFIDNGTLVDTYDESLLTSISVFAEWNDNGGSAYYYGAVTDGYVWTGLSEIIADQSDYCSSYMTLIENNDKDIVCNFEVVYDGHTYNEVFWLNFTFADPDVNSLALDSTGIIL